jgi:hypothetical protein
MAYIPDVGNRDVRTEGLSYGMMIAVQLDHQKEFNALWKFAKRFMYHDRGPLRGYFTWHTAYDGSMTRADGSVIRGAGPAPDGEEWFTMALFFAAHRWGNGEGIFNYEAEAQGLLRTMLHKDEEPTTARCWPCSTAPPNRSASCPRVRARISPTPPITCPRSTSSGRAGPRRPRIALPGRGHQDQPRIPPESRAPQDRPDAQLLRL